MDHSFHCPKCGLHIAQWEYLADWIVALESHIDELLAGIKEQAGATND